MIHRERPARSVRARVMRRNAARPSTCWTNKIQYPSERHASEAIRDIRRRDKDAEGLTPYKCWACAKWHLGHGLNQDP